MPGTKHRKSKKASVKHKAVKKSFTVVAIGASAGGLEAVSILLKNLPIDTGMAFIYVQHLDPNHKSLLTSILSRSTKMKVQEIDNMELIKPNNVYVMPHNKGIEVTDGHIKLIPRARNSSIVSIDVLFTSLAQTHGSNIIGIILSGHAKDGSLGIAAIKEAGGVTFAQNNTALASSMPKSAIASGAVDFILSPKEIAIEICRQSKNGNIRRNVKHKEITISNRHPDEKTVFEILHKRKGVDFSHYKMATINRRLNHRMAQCNKKTLKDYVKLLLKDSNEVDLLYKDLLINVTSFFRDTEVFRYLKNIFFPKLLKSKTSGEAIRIWIPACSTGEEAYSIAMLLTELQDKKTRKIPIKIFATDLCDHVISDARIAEYSEGDLKSISEKNKKRFFIKTGNNYNIIKEIREMCTFAPHNILSDPPFFRVDFISCRNLLIYFDIAAQKKVLATLHFALSDPGYLLLGKSETTGSSSQLFTQVNNKFKLYSRKKNTGSRKVPELEARVQRITNYKKEERAAPKKATTVDSSTLDSAIDSTLLNNYMPSCAIINRDMEILQFRGLTSQYLSHPSGGKASLNILKMTRPEFAFELRSAIHTVIKTKLPVTKSGIEIKVSSGFQMMSIEVSLLKIEWDEPLLLIVFTLQEEIKKPLLKKGKDGKNITISAVDAEKDLKIKKLVEELASTRAEMDTVIESQETSYQELQAANEEIVSTNEEFQTLNEELETSKEEIEATNEELISTNLELKTHNELLAESYDYSEAIIATIHEPMLILDSHLHVRSANNSFYKKFDLTKEETEGKSLYKLDNSQWNIPTLRALLDDILSKNSHFEGLEVTHVFPDIGEKFMSLNANRIIQKSHNEKLILLAIEDITERTINQQIADVKNEENIRVHEKDKAELEKAVKNRTKQFEQKNIELERANIELGFQNDEKEIREEELIIANKKLAIQNQEIEKRAAELIITNKKLSLQDARISHLAAIVESSQESIISKSLDGTIKSWNVGAEKMFGYTSQEAIGKNISIIIPPDHIKEEKKIIDKLKHGDRVEDYETIRKRKNGEQFPIAITISPLKNKEGKIIGFSKIARDITARKKAEKEILEKTKELSDANKELASQNITKEKQAIELIRANKDLITFTYVSSHDLQEPLRKIQNFASFIVKNEEERLSEEGKGYFNRMQETAKRMQALIEDLLTYSRAKTDEGEFLEKDISEMIEEVKLNFEDSILEKKAVINVLNPAKITVIPFQFRQLLHNLIGNSLKFSKPHQAPDISIKCEIVKGNMLNVPSLKEVQQKTSTLEVSRIMKRDYHHIIYSDNGIGFDPRYNERIFEVFQRLHGYDEYKGTGIGLAICKRIIENHHGIITATGVLNKGATFDIYIPV